MWKRAFRVTNDLYRSAWADFLILIVGFVFAYFLIPFDWLNLRASSPSETALTGIYTLIYAAVLYPVILLTNLIAAKNAEEHPSLLELGRLRTEGVQLRNKGMSLKTVAAVRKWHKNYDKWDDRMLTEMAVLSAGKSAWLRTLDRFMWRYSKTGFVNDEHQRIMNVFDEKLRRLDMILRKYLEIPLD